jgi:outer membrane protein OmpA-like peptidoglycan-associated protein
MRVLVAFVALLTMCSASGDSVEASLFTNLDAQLAQAREEQMPLLAPEAWDAAMRAASSARTSFERNRSLTTIQKSIDAATAALASAHDTMRLGRVTFEGALGDRASALSAGADKLAPQTFATAEEQFRKAAVSLEHGRSDKAQSLAAEAVQSYRNAELEAIKGAILRDARHLLAQADEEKVAKYAPRTLAEARASLAEAESALVEDRYDTDRPRLLAQQAKEQASHAIHLAAVIRAVDDDDRQFEAILLASEAPIVQIANVLDVTPDLSNGVASTAAQTLAAVKAAQRTLAQQKRELEERNETISTLETALGGASAEAMTLNSLLAEQQQRREQVAEAERLFTPEEAELTRSGNSLILRLVGLNFESGAAVIRTNQFPLLGKVEQAIAMFPDAVITVEGHTDSFGSDDLNLELSQRRADALRAFLLAQMDLAPYRISAMGYGEARPIATNDTAEGRARNRRIDLVITRSEG